MRDELISEVVQRMLPYLDNKQLADLQSNLNQVLQRYDVELIKGGNSENDSQELVEKFISAKRVEGCSEKTLKYYLATIESMTCSLKKDVRIIQTEDLRKYLTDYQTQNGSSKVTIDNIRRILSSFFSWLEDEDYIIKSPVRRIHKVKTVSNIKETYTDEELELMRYNCEDLRDLAIVDMLASTGMRIGEMVLLNRKDIDFNERECIVLGKGSKERVVCFDALQGTLYL
jgi:site-specific recombinase XerD